MERINFQVIEKKWQKKDLSRKNSIIKMIKLKSFIAWRCFLIPQEKYGSC